MDLSKVLPSQRRELRPLVCVCERERERERERDLDLVLGSASSSPSLSVMPRFLSCITHVPSSTHAFLRGMENGRNKQHFFSVLSRSQTVRFQIKLSTTTKNWLLVAPVFFVHARRMCVCVHNRSSHEILAPRRNTTRRNTWYEK